MGETANVVVVVVEVGQYGVVVVVGGPTYAVVVVIQAGGVEGWLEQGTTRRAQPEGGQSDGNSGEQPHEQDWDSTVHRPPEDTKVAVPEQETAKVVVVVVFELQSTPGAMRLSTPIGNRTTWVSKMLWVCRYRMPSEVPFRGHSIGPVNTAST